MKKNKNLLIVSIILFFLFLIELIPTISLQYMKPESLSRLDINEYQTITGDIINYHIYTYQIEIQLSNSENLETNWFETSYDMTDMYQETLLANDVYEGMSVTIIFYPTVEGYDDNAHYEIANLYANDKTYISINQYLQYEDEDYDLYLRSSRVHLLIDISFFTASMLSLGFFIKQKRKERVSL